MQDAFVAAVEAIYDAAPEPSRWPIALQAIADVTGDVGTVLSYQRDDGGFGAIGSPSIDALMREYAETWGGRDLRALRGVERGVFIAKDAVTDRDVVSEHEMDTHPFYGMLARHGLRYFAGIPISPDPHIVASIAVQRAIDRPPFSDDEMVAVTRLGRHCEKALRLSLQLINLKIAEQGLGEALGRVGIGVFVLDSLARVLFVNPAGAALKEYGLSVSNDRLKIWACPERGDIEAAIEQAVSSQGAARAIAARSMVVSRADGQRSLALHILPVASGDRPEERILTHARAIVLAIQPDIGGPPDPAQVRDVLGLTLGEARVAALVGSGLAPREAAVRLGIGEETARTALKRVFSKVGVSRQSELTALLTRLVLR
ncbi:MAG: helix-turn-helix transcriptional regulator [Rhodopseudomonas sp.]|uniref:helix-turn-helix transcriptional regulator n=1 Tax=Rhodopseudomonas sp. TaxID=1078 RepID=UPI0017E00440|nr:helix-turn-helix transcriptional regulator [Rhodopseudomonas sp.]NVN87287.1 helix-turn-helix transcriptional regulator [Rhodopseudomonas sp.]